jgi:hypothetical protein
MQRHSIKATLPLPDEVRRLAGLWPSGKPLFVVGGSVRDFAFHLIHGVPFEPKDFDLASELTTDEVESILRKARIPFNAIGAAFGIINARLGGREFEIASFREEWYDPETGDGRRPEGVKQGVSPQADASRRDLYFNALFYDIAAEEIIDFNDGHGIEDVRARRARMVGNPLERFREDRLRVVRFIRFFSRYNEGYILDHLDDDTRRGILQFRRLPGISAERKLQEFLAGLQQALRPEMFLRNLAAFPAHGPDDPAGGLMEAMFPGMKVDLQGIDRSPACRNPRAVLAWLFRGNDPRGFGHPRTGLGNRLKFPAWLTDKIEFLVSLFQWNFALDQVYPMLKKRDKFYQGLTETELAARKREDEQDVADFNAFAQLDPAALEHFLSYQPRAGSQEFIDRGLSGKELGRAIVAAETEAFRRSWESART